MRVGAMMNGCGWVDGLVRGVGGGVVWVGRSVSGVEIV